MRRFLMILLLAGGAWLPERAMAQEPTGFLSVGDPAPDIQVAGATRHGILADPVSLRELRGETVVLAFFFRARTGG